jgi:predicted anti-sigma-YlaC factor YlaD
VVLQEGRSLPVRSMALAGLLAALLVSSSCSVKKMAINGIADTLASSGSTFASDDDPELIRDAVPFSLKLMESVLADTPRHRGLLLAACSGFTQYAYAFVQVDAEMVEHEDYAKSEELKTRARRLYLRAYRYGLRNLEVAYPGIGARLLTDPEGAAREVTKKEDVPALYWTGASWGAAVSLGLDRPDLIADLPAVRALLGQALKLDESWGHGAIHEVFISLDAVALSKGLSAAPYVDLATTIAVADQDKAEFEKLLNAALAVDPDKDPDVRLANLITQKLARYLLDNVDLYIVSH